MAPGELQILALVATGIPLATVAKRTNLSERTVRRRLSRACDSLGVDTAMQAVVLAVRRGWI